MQYTPCQCLYKIMLRFVLIIPPSPNYTSHKPPPHPSSYAMVFWFSEETIKMTLDKIWSRSFHVVMPSQIYTSLIWDGIYWNMRRKLGFPAKWGNRFAFRKKEPKFCEKNGENCNFSQSFCIIRFLWNFAFFRESFRSLETLKNSFSPLPHPPPSRNWTLKFCVKLVLYLNSLDLL